MTTGRNMGGVLDRNQEQIIENAIRDEKRVTIFLKNGVPMRGRVLGHDAYTIFMQTDKNQALIYKHSITSMYPIRIWPKPRKEP